MSESAIVRSRTATLASLTIAAAPHGASLIPTMRSAPPGTTWSGQVI
jgi:hypothetical protein